MQNILAAQSEGATLRNTYINMNTMSSSHTFIIPVYENMPQTTCARPNTDGTSTTDADLIRVNVDSTLRIRNEPNGGTTIGWLYKDEIVTRLEKATTKVAGTYWDKVQKSNGTIGYAARETYDYESSYKLYLVPINENNSGNSGSSDTSDNNASDNTQTGTNTSKVKIDEAQKIITVVPDAIAQDILDAFGGPIKITRADGNTLDGAPESLATGYIVDDRYTVIKKGDTNGDGQVSPADYVKIVNHIMGVSHLTDIMKSAADINNDNNITPADYVKVVNQIMGYSNISL